MVLAAVDDIFFASKITAAAKQLGVEVRFSRPPADIVDRAREFRPALAIFDLNSRQTDPLATIATLKEDASLSAMRVIGFVSHVQADLIEAARATGIDEVMARSAFTTRLPEILKSASA